MYIVIALIQLTLFIIYVLIWSDNHQLKFGSIIYQPFTYWKQFSFKLKNMGYYVFIPIILYMSLLVLQVILATIFGFWEISDGNKSIMNFYKFNTFNISYTLFFIFLAIRSLTKTRCVICHGKKYVEGDDDVIDLHYPRKTRCFCCDGVGFVHNKSELGTAHLNLEQNIQLMRKYEAKKIKLGNQIESLKMRQSKSTLIDRLTAKFKLNKEIFDYYDITVRKLAQLIQEKHIYGEYQNDKETYDKDLGQVMISKEVYKDTSEMLLHSIEVMNQKIEMQDYNPDTIEDIRKEIEKIKNEVIL